MPVAAILGLARRRSAVNLRAAAVCPANAIAAAIGVDLPNHEKMAIQLFPVKFINQFAFFAYAESNGFT